MPVKSGFWVNVWKGANDYATGTERLPMSGERQRQLRADFFALSDAEARDRSGDRLQYSMLTAVQLEELQGKNEVEREKIFRRYATTWITSNPQRFLELCLIRLYKSLWIDLDNPRANNIAYIASRSLLLVLGVVGLLTAVALRWRIFYPLTLAASCISVYTLTLTAARFMVPLEPIQLALGVSVIDWVASRRGSHHK
jgi:hypothetical protein